MPAFHPHRFFLRDGAILLHEVIRGPKEEHRVTRPSTAFLCRVLFVVLAVWSSAFGDTRGFVTRVQGEDIVVNLGLQKNMRPGTKLYVYDAHGKPLATVQVTEVDDVSSRVHIVSMEPGALLTVGSQVSDQPYVSAPVPPKASSPPSSNATLKIKPIDPVKAFREELKKHTQLYSFRGGKGGMVKIDAFDVLNTVSTLGIGGGSHSAIVNPWLITGSIFDTYNVYRTTARMNQKARSFLQIVYWDEALAASYADYYLYKEAVSDAARRADVRRSLMAQKGVQTSAVFQVKLRNQGPGALQLAPFDWHAYLLDPEGNRVKAERYDEILDKALNPGQEVDGYLYFPRRDPLGKAYVGSPPTLLIDDVFGERALVKFDRLGTTGTH